MKRLFFLPVLLFCLFLSSPAESSPFSVGVSAGTLGLGADVGFQWNNFLKTRLNANILPISSLNFGLEDKLGLDDVSLPAEKMNIDIDTTHYTLGLLLDVHPFMGSFRLSGGLYYINLNLDVTGAPRGNEIRYGNQTFNSRDFGSLKGELSWSRFAPYLGLGWGTDRGEDTDFFIDFNLGVMRLSNPRLKVGATGPIALGLMYDSGGSLVSASSVAGGAEAYQRYLNKQAQVEKEFRDLRKYLYWYPVVSLGFTLRF
jgi:hypothetical protein